MKSQHNGCLLGPGPPGLAGIIHCDSTEHTGEDPGRYWTTIWQRCWSFWVETAEFVQTSTFFFHIFFSEFKQLKHQNKQSEDPSAATIWALKLSFTNIIIFKNLFHQI